MSNLSGISEYLNLAEVKESVREGADSVKKLMKEPSGLTKTEMSLLLAVFADGRGYHRFYLGAD